MSDVIIQAENISKQYKIGAQQEPYGSLRESLVRALTAPFRRKSKADDQYIWALKDISFEIKRGEVVGIIGRNGAGKSTLLKILSRITKPTTGHVRMYGRVGSLLEVGTGFHPELTGRENIYLNGAILGMRRHEIEKKFDEIVDFAEIEKFLDTPVKRYSSGMYVRLAFAVAAHLEPEILLVDEVLAVGDAAFQKKCLGKMGEVAQGGRTVLFVSHNMAAVEGLCERGILLQNGEKITVGITSEVIQRYMVSIKNLSNVKILDRLDRIGNGQMKITDLCFMMNDQQSDILVSGKKISAILSYEAQRTLTNVKVSLSFFGSHGQFLLLCDNQIAGFNFTNLPSQGKITCTFDKFPFAAGNYSINIYSEVNNIIADWIQEAVHITVSDGDFFGSGRTVPSTHGGILINQYWDYLSSDS